VADRAGLVDLQAKALSRAVERLVQADVDVGLDVVATSSRRPRAASTEQILEAFEVGRLSGAARARPRAEVAEDRPEEVREPAEVLGVAVLDVEASREAGSGLASARLLGVALPVRAETVIAPALFGVGQNLVRLVDFLELVGRSGTFRDIRMVLAG